MDDRSVPVDANRVPVQEPGLDEKSEHLPTTTTSSDSSSETELDETRHTAHNKEPDYRVGTPDIDHDEIEAVVPGHALDVELGKEHDGPALRRLETRNSVRSKVSHAISIISRVRTATKKGDRIAHDPLPVTDLSQGIVGWEGQDDPEMPLNFTRKKKWLIVGLLSATTVLTPFASSILAPGIESLDVEFGNTSSIIGAMTVSIYLLGYTVGPLFLAPLSEIYGRKPILGLSNIFFCLWQIGCALAPSIGALIAFRFFSGIGGIGPLTLGAGVIADVFHTDERGFAMGIFTIGPLLGPTIGPLVGGYVAETIGWRWDFWIILIIGAAITIAIEIFNRETNSRVLIERKVRRLKKELGRDDLRSCYETAGPQPSSTRILWNGLVRPVKLLFLSPLVLSLSLYLAFAYGVLYLLFTTIPIVFQETYGWSVGTTGLVYISLGLGNFFGWSIITLRTDRDVVRRTQANDGVFEPEMRLPISIYFGLFLPVTFFWYGWTTYYETHWIVPVISLFPFAVGIIGIFLPITTYLVDCYPAYAASAIAASTVFRSLAGAVLPLAGPAMYATLGLGWGNSLLGFLAIGMVPVPLLIHRFGKRLRTGQKFVL